MSYEEKYKDALNKAKSKIENDKGHVLYEDDIIDIFPELAESEDVRISREITEFLVDFNNGEYKRSNENTIDSWLSWLEKQGEKDSQGILPTFTFDDILALQCCMRAMSKNDELYKKLQSLHDRLHEVYGFEKQGEQNTAWNEEDETNLTNTIIMLKEGASLHFTNSSITPCVDWLKSLKPNHWKPSEEQLNAFEHFVRSIGESGYTSPYDNNTKLLYSLLNDLKNL